MAPTGPQPPSESLPSTDPLPRGTYVQSLERGLAMIRAFDAEHPELTLSEAAERTGMSRASARRFLLTLQELGYVHATGRAFRLGPKVLTLGYAYLSGQSLRDVAEPRLRALSEQLGESVSLSVLDEESVVYIARVAASRIMTIGISVGTRLPATTTSMGRVLLSGLDEAALTAFLAEHPAHALTQRTVTDPAELAARIREAGEQGYCLVDQELETGLRSLAVPVPGGEGRIVAALNVSTRVGTDAAEASALLGRALPALRGAAGEIAEELSLAGHVL